MSYFQAIGTLEPWDYVSAHVYMPKDVFVLRLRVRGALLTSPRQAVLFVRAAGRGQNLGLDVRGVCFWKAQGVAAADDTMVDVVMTTKILRSPSMLSASDAKTMAKNMGADAELRAAFPAVSIQDPVFGQLTGPADAIDHWLSQPLLWDQNLGTHDVLGYGGGPTDTFAAPAEYSVVRGKADDGKRVVPWTEGALPDLGSKKPGETGGTAVLWVLGLAAAAGVGWLVWTNKKGRS